MSHDLASDIAATDLARSVLDSAWLSRLDELKAAFAAEAPLPGFVVVDDFLSPSALESATSEIRGTATSTYTVWSEDGDPLHLKCGFVEPNETYYYLTVHRRPTSPLPTLDRLAAALGAPPVLEIMRALTGRPISRLGMPCVLTAWDPGDFLGEHCDAGPVDRPAQLIVSLSLTLTDTWSERYGGCTKFSWDGSEREVTTWPHTNRAVIFAPHRGSLHWVERLTREAPARTRFTWTLHYE